MRRTIQVVLYTAAIAGAAAGSYFAAERVADELEVRNGAAVRGALSRAGIDFAWVEIDGLLAILRGPAPDEAARFRALAAAGEVLNPLNLRDEMSVSVPSRPTQTAYRIEIMRNGGSILIHGLGPQDGGPDLTPLVTSDPDLEIVDLVARVADPVSDSWREASVLAVEAVDALRTVRVVLTPDATFLEGIAPDRETALGLERLLGDVSELGMSLEIALELPRPVLSPFITRFVLDSAGARFDVCAAESKAGQEAILAAAVAAGASQDTVCSPALGTPDPNWSATVTRGIDLVAGVGAGTITFADLNITASLPGAALSDPEVLLRLDRFETSLPEIYSLAVLQSDAEETSGEADETAPRFTATRSPEGLVNLRGPVGPLEAREIVRTLAEARFGEDALHTALRGATTLPADWAVHVMAAVDALAKLDTGAVTLGPDLISVRGVTGDPEAETAITRALTEKIGPRLGYAIEITYREELDPVVIAQAPNPDECVARVNAVLEENEVSFPPGSVEIATDGFDTVGAIAEVLFDCPDVKMEIGGHTDSQGREEMNQLLSQARADAVLNALMERRVLVGNLTSVGYGEAQPIADNDTAEGREANRRIRFSLVSEEGEAVQETGETQSAVATDDVEETDSDG